MGHRSARLTVFSRQLLVDRVIVLGKPVAMATFWAPPNTAGRASSPNYSSPRNPVRLAGLAARTWTQPIGSAESLWPSGSGSSVPFVARTVLAWGRLASAAAARTFAWPVGCP